MEITVTIDNSFAGMHEPPNPYTKKPVKSMHCHAIHELFFVKDKALVVLTEDAPLEFKNCVVCIPPLFMHNSIRCDDLRMLFSYKINAKKTSGFAAFLDSLFSARSPISANIDDSIGVCFAQLKNLAEGADKLSKEIVTSVLKMIFYNIYCCNAAVMKNGSMDARESYLITIDDILNNYQNDFSLKMMAGALNLSTKQTSRIIRKNYKSTLAELVTAKRLRVACTLLTDSNMAVADIVEHIHFASPSYFYHQFKKAYGCTPLQYRKSSRKNPHLSKMKDEAFLSTSYF